MAPTPIPAIISVFEKKRKKKALFESKKMKKIAMLATKTKTVK